MTTPTAPDAHHILVTRVSAGAGEPLQQLLRAGDQVEDFDIVWAVASGLIEPVDGQVSGDGLRNQRYVVTAAGNAMAGPDPAPQD